MAKPVPNDLKAAMQLAGAESYPNEACGLVVKVGEKSRILSFDNAAENKRWQFRISSVDFAAACDMGEVIGVWHTHCDIPETPSEADRASCEASEVTWYILSVRQVEEGAFGFSEVHVLNPTGFEMPYLERPYVFGIFDCYSLVRDYYWREYGIHLNDYPHIDNWSRLGHNFFVDNFTKEGFVVQIDQEPQPGDVFLIQSEATVPNHMAVYLGNEIILHQTHGRLSRRDIYGGYWLKHTSHHLRHISKC